MQPWWSPALSSSICMESRHIWSAASLAIFIPRLQCCQSECPPSAPRTVTQTQTNKNPKHPLDPAAIGALTPHLPAPVLPRLHLNRWSHKLARSLMLTLSLPVKRTAATSVLTLSLFPPVVGHDTPAHPPGRTAAPLCPNVLSDDCPCNPYLMDSACAPLPSRCFAPD